MPNRELTTSTRYIQLTEPQNRAAAFRSAYVDLQGWDAVDFLVEWGDTTAAAAEGLQPTLMEDDGAGLPTAIATYSNVAAADRTGAFPFLTDNLVAGNAVVGYRGSRRYVHVNFALTVAFASGVIGVTAVLRKFSRQPSNTVAVTTGAVT